MSLGKKTDEGEDLSVTPGSTYLIALLCSSLSSKLHTYGCYPLSNPRNPWDQPLSPLRQQDFTAGCPPINILPRKLLRSDF